jgi:transcriptional regulator with XRE-family HTH domain
MSEKPTSTFSRRFAAALRGYARGENIRQEDVAAHLKRSEAYVSDHLSGKRPPDTDLFDAVAELAGVDSLELWTLIRDRMSSNPSPRGPENPGEDRAATANRIAKKAVSRKKAAPAKPRVTRRRKKA